MKYSLRKLFQQSFEDHKGRPGERGGSLPRDGGSHQKASQKKRKELRGLLEEATLFEKSLPGKLGNLSDPKTIGELKTGLKLLKGLGDLREQAKETLTGAGWKHIMRDEMTGADVYRKGPFVTEIYFGRGKTRVQFRKKGHSYQSL